MASSSKSNQSQSQTDPPPALKIYIVVTLRSPLPPHDPLSETHGVRLAGGYLTRVEAMHKAYEFLNQQNYISTQPFFTELGQDGYKVNSPVVISRAWVEELGLNMSLPIPFSGREAALEDVRQRGGEVGEERFRCGGSAGQHVVCYGWDNR